MSNKSKIAVVTAASLGLVLTQSSASRAENGDSSAPQVTKIAAPIDVNEEVFYTPVSDDALERASGTVDLAASTGSPCVTTAICGKAQPIKKPPTSQSKKPKQ